MQDPDKITALITRIEKVQEAVISSLGNLSSSQFTWKPKPEIWSIAECLQHLIRSNETYFPLLDNLSKGYTPGFWEKHNPFSRSIGQSMVKSLGKNVSRKYKSPKLFLPAPIKLTENVHEKFHQHQALLADKFRKLIDLEPDHIIITSPISPLITFPLSDCLEVIVSHEERHLDQAGRLLTHADFPAT